MMPVTSMPIPAQTQSWRAERSSPRTSAGMSSIEFTISSSSMAMAAETKRPTYMARITGGGWPGSGSEIFTKRMPIRVPTMETAPTASG